MVRWTWMVAGLVAVAIATYAAFSWNKQRESREKREHIEAFLKDLEYQNERREAEYESRRFLNSTISTYRALLLKYGVYSSSTIAEQKMSLKELSELADSLGDEVNKIQEAEINKRLKRESSRK